MFDWSFCKRAIRLSEYKLHAREQLRHLPANAVMNEVFPQPGGPYNK